MAKIEGSKWFRACLFVVGLLTIAVYAVILAAAVTGLIWVWNHWL